MHEILTFLKSLHTPEGLQQLIVSGGALVLVAIIFAETGLLVGFFLPGDSLLVTAGVVAAKASHLPGLNIWVLNGILVLAAIIGDQVGFWLGTKCGPKIFTKDDSFFFKKRYAQEAHDFYLKHGGAAVIIARFMPILRTFVPFIAGVADMPYRRFVGFNIIGGILWVTSLLWIGYAVGQTPLADQLHHIILFVVVISILPLVIGFIKRFLKKSE